jgi:N-acetylmuramoyl-L-alanine amidase
MPDQGALADLNLKVEFIAAGRHNRPGTVIRPLYITIHNTDNTDAGADAERHSKFVRETGYYVWRGRKHWVSWHCTVDDQVAIQHLPFTEMAFHAGDQANRTSIAIEICMQQGIDQPAANQRAARLTAGLMKDLNINIDHVRPHEKWTGKDCPVLLLNNGVPGQKWQQFLASVTQIRNSIPPAAGPLVLTQSELHTLTEAAPSEEMETAGAEEDMDHGLVAKEVLKLK